MLGEASFRLANRRTILGAVLRQAPFAHTRFENRP